MTKFLIIIVAIFLSCSDLDTLQSQIDWLESSIIYTKDKRTNICFAVKKYGDNSIDNRTLTCVPCEKIPPDLLR
jgi:hypothetical protein